MFELIRREENQINKKKCTKNNGTLDGTYGYLGRNVIFIAKTNNSFGLR